MPENTAKMSSPSPTSINKALDLGTALKRKASLSSITTRRNGVVQSSKPLKVIVLGQASVGKTDVRLAGTGSNERMGRVEIYYNGEWGTVCDDWWGLIDASVVCRQLGYTDGASGFTIGAREFGEGSGKIFLDDVRCVGNENRITDCPSLWNTEGRTNCRHSEDSGVKCQGARSAVVPDGGSASSGVVRLAGTSSSANQGRVEVYANGQWGTVCDDFWGQMDADVVCRQLGFPGASGFTVAARTFGPGTGPILLDNVECAGNEASIMDCRMVTIGTSNCRHGEDAGVICNTVAPAVVAPAVVAPVAPVAPVIRDGDVRLAGSGSSDSRGRVEVYDNGQWGTVCDDLWDIQDARVVCRQLGFREALAATTLARFGRGTGPILLDNVECEGDETSIMACRKNPIRSHNCGHHEDAGAICTDASIVRLAGIGSSDSQGRVEVFANGQWGTVCDDLWGQADGDVVCRQLGFSGASSVTTRAERFGQGTVPIRLDNVECEGDEPSIMQCSMNAIGSHNCHHSEDAGVMCNTDKRRREEDVELYHKIKEQVGVEEGSNDKKEDDLKKKDVLQALSDLLAELKDK